MDRTFHSKVDWWYWLLTWGRSFNFYNIDLLVGPEFYAYKYEFLSA